MDCQRLGSKFQEPAPSYIRHNDSVIDYQFKTQNKSNYDSIMKDHAEKLLVRHNLNKNTIFESDNNYMQKLNDFDEYLHTQSKLPQVSPMVIN